MNKFKSGDWVVRVLNSHGGMKEGDIAQIEFVRGVNLTLKDFNKGGSIEHDATKFRLALCYEIPKSKQLNQFWY